MCVLCDKDNLRLLVAPLGSLSHRELADAVAIAREAAWQLVLDTADAGTEVDRAEAPAKLNASGYVEYIVERAEREGALPQPEALVWATCAQDESIYRDPRVQAFLSAAAEGLAAYTLQVDEHKRALELFLEERNGGISFAGVGMNGEAVFERGAARYIVMSDAEALTIAMERLAMNLCNEEPQWLLEYTNLPRGAADILSAMQQGPPDRVNDILAGIIDLEALTQDRVKQVGFAPFVTEGVSDEYSEQRFGDRIIIRLRMPEKPMPPGIG